MIEITGIYEGNLHCAATHTPSGATLSTDAPKDNHGLGESFSPTDLLATSLGACMMTIIAISAKKHAIDLTGSKFRVLKEMSSTPPRRVAKLTAEFTLPLSVPESNRPALEAAARACPVHQSLHPDIHIQMSFIYA